MLGSMKRWLLTLPLLVALFSVLSGAAHRGQPSAYYVPPMASATWSLAHLAHDSSWESGLDALVAEIEDATATFEEAEEETDEKDAKEGRTLPPGGSEPQLSRAPSREPSRAGRTPCAGLSRASLDARQHPARGPPRLG
jgi:hypothetical protein